MTPSQVTLKTEDCRRLSIGMLHRSGYLRASVDRVLSWASTEGASRSVLIRTHPPHHITLQYDITHHNGTKQPVEDWIQIRWTSCHLGGQRPWFECPRCGHRAGILFLRGGYFRCRQCQGLRYRCKSESSLNRARRKIGKIERRLGDDQAIKPKGMHQSTFQRLQRKLEKAEEVESDLLFDALLRSFNRQSLSKPSPIHELFDQQTRFLLNLCFHAQR